MSNKFNYFIIKFLNLFKFNKTLSFNFKNLVNFFCKFFINKTIFNGINIG